MRGLTTIEWLVIAAIVLIASRYVIGYWSGVWNPTKEKAEELGEEFNDTLNELSFSGATQSSLQQGLPELRSGDLSECLLLPKLCL